MRWKEAGIHVKQAHADADRLIVTTALVTAQREDNVVLVDTDTDLLIMLVACASTTSKLLMLHPSTSNRPQTIYSISSIQECLGPTKQNMLFLHAVTGCVYLQTYENRPAPTIMHQMAAIFDLTFIENLKIKNSIGNEFSTKNHVKMRYYMVIYVK